MNADGGQRVLNGSTELTQVLLRTAPNKPATRLWQSSIESSVDSFGSPTGSYLYQMHPRQSIFYNSNQSSVSGPEFGAQSLRQGQVVGIISGGERKSLG